MRILICLFLSIFLIAPVSIHAQTTTLSERDAQIADIIERIADLQIQLLLLTSTTSLSTSTVERTISSITDQLEELFSPAELDEFIQRLRTHLAINPRLTEFISWSWPRSGIHGGASNTTLGITTFCPVITRDLRYGSEGDDVRQLQRFLKELGFFEGDITTFFGTITEQSVKKWQSGESLVSSGDAESTGWGLIGPKSRKRIAELCGNEMSISATEGSCTFGGKTYQSGTMVIPCAVADPLSACFGGVSNETTFIHPVCKKGSWINKGTGAAVSQSTIKDMEKSGGVVKSIYDPQGILSL